MLEETIKNELAKNSSEIQITYLCRTTQTNGEYIEIKIGDNICYRIDGDNTNTFVKELNGVVDFLSGEYPNLHIVTRPHEFHFYYCGFNSCSTKVVPVIISNKDASKEIKKTGVVTLKKRLVGKSTVMSIINEHPDYELYNRYGFGFRGAQERQCTLEEMVRMLDWMCCADVDVVDNEIHVNGFSYSDMD